MMDMTAVIIPKSDQWNADDFIAGPMTFTITDVKVQGGQEQPVSISVAGSQKVYRPCKSMSRVLVAAWGPDANQYRGRSLTLYRDPGVKWGGMAVGGIRISHMTDIAQDLTLMLTMTKQNRAPHKVKVLRVEQKQPAAPSAGDLPALTPSEAIAIAEAAAKKGADYFRQWFNSDEGKDCRATKALTPAEMLRLKGICEQADASREEDPFGLPEIDPLDPMRVATSTPAEIEAAILAEQRARDAAMEGGAV